VGVVGSSHSAILVLRNILEAANPPSKVVNLYRSPLLYAVYMDGWIKYDNTGKQWYWQHIVCEAKVLHSADAKER
jgi:hypothetical protein